MDDTSRPVDADLDVNQLAFEATRWLRRSGVTAGDGRVAADVDTRTVRYYASLGLVDRPTRYADRRAYYGRRHLLQIVAVKRLQAAGAALADLQARLAGATDDELATVAGGGEPPTLPASPNAALSAEPAAPFWLRRARPGREPLAAPASVVRQAPRRARTRAGPRRRPRPVARRRRPRRRHAPGRNRPVAPHRTQES